MNIDPKKSYAVISGDFIGFSHLPLKYRQSMYSILKNGGKELAEAFPGIMPCEVDMFRGDGWQMLLTDPVYSLRAALYFRAYIRSKTTPKKIDTRMAIAVGKIDYVPENRVSAGDGTAFRLSGKLLEKIMRQKSSRMAFVMEDAKSSLRLDRLVRRVDPFAARLTQTQALAVAAALKDQPRCHGPAIQGGEHSPEKVARPLIRAGWPLILETISDFEMALW